MSASPMPHRRRPRGPCPCPRGMRNSWMSRGVASNAKMPEAPAELIDVPHGLLSRTTESDAGQLAHAVGASLDHLRRWLSWAGWLLSHHVVDSIPGKREHDIHSMTEKGKSKFVSMSTLATKGRHGALWQSSFPPVRGCHGCCARSGPVRAWRRCGNRRRRAGPSGRGGLRSLHHQHRRASRLDCASATPADGDVEGGDRRPQRICDSGSSQGPRANGGCNERTEHPAYH